jgi:conjugal transfer pilus assembly protein TraA
VKTGAVAIRAFKQENQMKIKTAMKTALLSASITLATPLAAYAGTIDSNDPFYSFYTTISHWTQGALGVGLAMTMLLMGGAIGVARNSPMPALTGVAGAAFLHWGPQIIQQLMVSGAVF